MCEDKEVWKDEELPPGFRFAASDKFIVSIHKSLKVCRLRAV